MESWEIALREKSELEDLLERRVREKEANGETCEVGQGQILKGVCTGYRVWMHRLQSLDLPSEGVVLASVFSDTP